MLLAKQLQMQPDMEKFDVIIIGAGAAGLMAAKILSNAKKKVCILEARDVIGGRAHTIIKRGFSKPIETGAEFIHGNLPLTLKLLKKAAIKSYKTEGALWQVKNNTLKKREDFLENADEIMHKLKKLDNDMSIAEFLKKYFNDEKYAEMKHTLQQYLEGYDAGDINDYSSIALKEEWENEDEEQYRIDGGYSLLFDDLKNDFIKDGGTIQFNHIAKKIKWNEQDVEIMTKENKIFNAHKIIITVPLPMLSGNDDEASIAFDPALPVVTEAAKQIGYGGVVKIIFEFTHAFWETGEVRKAKDLFFIFSEEKIPTWWTQLPDKIPMLTGWLAGPKSYGLSDADADTILQIALQSLSSIFAIDKEMLQQYIKAWHVHNWNADPFSKGGYSYSSVTTNSAKEILRKPVADTLFFAGEALWKDSNATVEAALQSGKEVAENILKMKE